MITASVARESTDKVIDKKIKAFEQDYSGLIRYLEEEIKIAIESGKDSVPIKIYTNDAKIFSLWAKSLGYIIKWGATTGGANSLQTNMVISWE